MTIHNLKCRPCLLSLENRVNPGAVTTTLDFDPRTYVPTDINTYKPGYLRFEVIRAFEAGTGSVTFDTSVDLGGGVHFGDPISSANTIKLSFGQIGNIVPRESGSTVTFETVPFTNVKILAPKYTDSTKDYVNIHWDSSIFPLFGDPNAGADWSVVKVTSQKKSLDERYPSYVGMSLVGLKLTNGRAGDGAGINAHGFINLNIDQCLITGNSADAVSGTNAPSTSGGGIFTQGAAVTRKYPGGGTRPDLIYGPNVVITNSHVDGNNTDTNNDDLDPPGIDYGGGMYLGYGTSLNMSNSTVNGNKAENGGGGIYFEGGAFWENPTTDGGESELFTTFLRISRSHIDNNAVLSVDAGHGSGGGLVIAGPTGGMISDTTFGQSDGAGGNKAQRDGGAVYISSAGGPLVPYVALYPFVGQVNFMACTFEDNQAAQLDSEGKPGFRGTGGAITVDGVDNDVFLLQSTISNNKTQSGNGGGVFVAPSEVDYHWRGYFDVDYDNRFIGVKNDFKIIVPDVPVTIVDKVTLLEFYNSTVAYNKAGGSIFTDDKTGNKTLYGARGGGLAVNVNAEGNLDGQIFVTSTIVAKNTVSPATSATPGGFGPDLWAADDGGALVILPGHGQNKIDPTKYDTGYNLVGISNDGGIGGNPNNAGCLVLDCSVTPGNLASPLDPKLYPLAYNGNFVKTHAIGYTSPAYETGDNPLSLDYDERGETRIRAKYTDIGAYEATGFAVEFPTVMMVSSGNVTTQFVNQRSMITYLKVYMDPLAVGETLNVYSATFANGIYSPVMVLPINTAIQTAVYFAPWDKYVTEITITFQASAFTYELNQYSLNANALIDGRYVITVGEPVVPFPEVSHVVPDFGFWRLFGDITGDAAVANNDFNGFKMVFGGEEFSLDYDGDGAVSGSDFNQFKARFGGGV